METNYTRGPAANKKGSQQKKGSRFVRLPWFHFPELLVLDDYCSRFGWTRRNCDVDRRHHNPRQLDIHIRHHD